MLLYQLRCLLGLDLRIRRLVLRYLNLKVEIGKQPGYRNVTPYDLMSQTHYTLTTNAIVTTHQQYQCQNNQRQGEVHDLGDHYILERYLCILGSYTV